MRYFEQIGEKTETGQVIEACWRLIVYVKSARNVQDTFIRACRDADIVFSHADDNGYPIPVHANTSLRANGRYYDDVTAYELYLPNRLCAVLDSMIGKRLPVVHYHFIESASIPYGMGKLTGMQKASRKRAPIVHPTGRISDTSKETFVQHGKPYSKPRARYKRSRLVVKQASFSETPSIDNRHYLQFRNGAGI